MTSRAVKLLVFSGIAAASIPGGVPSAEPGFLEWRVRTGTDLIGEQFHLIDEDTLDLTTELRTQLQARWSYPGSELASCWRAVDLDHRVGIGTEAFRYDFSGKAVWHPDSAWRLDMRGLSLARYYLGDAGGVRSDFVQGRLQAILERDLFDENSAWGIDQGIEGTAYRAGSPTLLDGLRHWHGFVVDGQRGFDFYGGRVVLEHERIPDSTALDYVGIVGDGYATWSLSDTWDLSGDASFIGKRYRDPGVHPHQSTLAANVRLGWQVLPDWSVELNPALTLASYDPADSIFYGYRRTEAALSLIRWTLWGSLRGGPRAAWQYSRALRGDEYVEWGMQAGVNLFTVERGFADLRTEFGWRNYLHDDEAFFSDYRYWDTALLATARLPWRLQLDAFVVFRAEFHATTLDDTRSILLAIDLSRTLNR